MDIHINLDDEDKRKRIEYISGQYLPLYTEQESVKGRVSVRVKNGKKLEHNGVKVEFIGEIGLVFLF